MKEYKLISKEKFQARWNKLDLKKKGTCNGVNIIKTHKKETGK